MGLLCAVTTYAQKMHMCADNAPSACLCANAYSAQTMRRCAFGLYDARIRILRILCADAQMRLCAYYAHIICRCAYYADMLILCAYYPYMFILFVLQIKHSPPLLTYTDPPRWWNYPPAPALIHCKTYYKSSILPFYTEGRGPEAWRIGPQPLP